MRKNFPYDTEDLWNKDRRHVVHAWEPLETGRTEGSMIIAEAEGIYIYDSDGNKYIDGPGGMWCVQIGYGRDEMADAVADQIRAMPYYSPFTYFGTAPASNLAAKIAELAPGDLNNVFMSTSGSEANDSAIRFVQFFNNMLGRPDKKHVITRQDAYHGSTYLAASLCGKERDKNHMDMITDWVHHISSPAPYRRPDDQSIEDFRDAKVKELEDKILEVGADKVAAFIAEPVLASGGMMVPPDGYHKMCLDVCHKHDVIYISDEVVTGFGRLGHFFASEPVFDIVPDILTCAKGLTSGYLPLAATIISDRLYDQVEGDNSQGQSFSNGYTYSAHPVSCAAALKNIEIMEREKICEHVLEVGPYLHEKLEELRDLSIVGDVRGKMLMGCVEAVMDKGTKEAFPYEAQIGKRIDVHAQERGLILRPFGSMCVFSPPLVITKDQIDTMVGIMRDAISATIADLNSEGVWSG